MKDHNLDRAIRKAPIEMSAEEFRQAGHELIDRIAAFLETLQDQPVTHGETPSRIQHLLGHSSLPSNGMPADQLLKETSELLFNHSLFNGHPRFWGYITSSAAPIGALGDLLAAAVNPNVGAWLLSPMASEIERQAIRWLAEFIGYSPDCGGLFVSGGNMANFVCFLAARTAKLSQKIRENGMANLDKQPVIYCSKATHTWIEKAADLFGLGTKAIHWIQLLRDQTMDITVLEQQIKEDINRDYHPIMVIGNAGTVGTGAIDPLAEIAGICKQYDLWFHIDGAYGVPAAGLPENEPLFEGLREADSVALDPHKWLYAPIEAGCTLVKDVKALQNTFSHHPEYYHFDGSGEEPLTNFHEFGLQNSRGFRALKVWLGLRQVGREGYIQMIREDIELAMELHRLVSNDPELEAFGCNLSITTFRFKPEGLDENHIRYQEYLNALNTAILDRLQAGGEVFLSNAVIDGNYYLRSCIVNFRTDYKDIEMLPEIVIKTGKAFDATMRPTYL